jgi:pyruvate dehydrogenase (quinone)
VLELKTDPEVPPLPPHITFKNARAFTSTAVKGDPNEGAMIKGSIKQVLSSVFAED